MQSISPRQLCDLSGAGKVELIDVRTPAEFASVHAECARNVPLHNLDPQSIMAARNGSAHLPLYVICKGGGRSKQACQKFLDAGFSNVVNVEGGTDAWVQAGLPVKKSGRKAMAIDRQMRILAGTLILLGIILSVLVHPGFQGLSAFIGGGLIFAGVTDCCPMMNVIAKMPWNQAPAADCNACKA
jgi:rhodanese-related sulfurtransferase